MQQNGTKRVVFTRPSGRMSIGVPNSDTADDAGLLTTWIADKLAAKAGWVHEATIEDTALPTRHARTRNAWTWNGTSSALEVDLPTARTDIVDRVRTERNKKMLDTDGMQQRADEIGTAQNQTDWNNHRQSLRDIPSTVQTDLDALTTALGLETYAVPWPTPPDPIGKTREDLPTP